MRVGKDLNVDDESNTRAQAREPGDTRRERRELDSLSRVSRVPSDSRVCACISHARLTLTEITRGAYSQTSEVEFSSLFISLDRVFPEKLLNKRHKVST